MCDTIQLTIMNETKHYPRGTRYMDVARDIQKNYKDDIVLMMMDNQLRELRKEISEDGVVTAITTKDPAGISTYRRSVVLLMQRAYHNIKPESDIIVQNSFGQGLFCELRDGEIPTDELITKLRDEMKKLVEQD